MNVILDRFKMPDLFVYGVELHQYVCYGYAVLFFQSPDQIEPDFRFFQLDAIEIHLLQIIAKRESYVFQFIIERFQARKERAIVIA